MKKAVILFLSLLLIFSSISVSVAEERSYESSESLIEERFIGLSQVSASLIITNNTAKCKATAFANSSEYKLYVTLSLQKKSGNTWNNIANWSKSGSGVTGVVLSKTKSGLTSGTYRCKTYVRVYDSNGNYVESTTEFSQSFSI